MILGIDIGGTSVKMGLVDEAGKIHARHEVGVYYGHYATPILTTVINEVQIFLRKGAVGIDGIGVSATGQIDTDAGTVIGTNGKIPQYEGTEIKKEMERAFNVPVFVLNDANAAVLGESFAGRAKGMQQVVMITLGTGVGGGVILDGKLLMGTRGIAGELGHFTLYQNGMSCSCGKRGCFEGYAATTALVRHAYEATGVEMNGRMIFERVKAGDKALKSVLNRWIDDIAAGVSGLVHIFNPQIVLIGGGVSAQEELLIVPLRKRVLSTIMPRFAEGLQIEKASLGNDAGMIGAAKYFIQRITMH